MRADHSDSIADSPREVLLVEDHPVVRMGLITLINNEPDLRVCGEAESAAEAIRLIQTLNPDVAIVDLTLEDSSGLDLIKNLRSQGFSLPILVLSMHDESIFAERVIRSGAQGYIFKRKTTAELRNGIRRVLDGEIYLSPKTTTNLLKALLQGHSHPENAPLQTLTDRELEVLQRISAGNNRRDIAKALNLSVKTVETHRSNIMKKLSLANGTELIRYALHWTNS